MAYESVGTDLGFFTAAADLSAKQFYFVKLASSTTVNVALLLPINQSAYCRTNQHQGNKLSFVYSEFPRFLLTLHWRQAMLSEPQQTDKHNQSHSAQKQPYTFAVKRLRLVRQETSWRLTSM